MDNRLKTVRRLRRIAMVVTIVALFLGLHDGMKLQNVISVVIAAAATIGLSVYELVKLGEK